MNINSSEELLIVISLLLLFQNTYPMCKKPRGHAIIVNISEFKCPLEMLYENLYSVLLRIWPHVLYNREDTLDILEKTDAQILRWKFIQESPAVAVIFKHRKETQQRLDKIAKEFQHLIDHLNEMAGLKQHNKSPDQIGAQNDTENDGKGGHKIGMLVKASRNLVSSIGTSITTIGCLIGDIAEKSVVKIGLMEREKATSDATRTSLVQNIAYAQQLISQIEAELSKWDSSPGTSKLGIKSLRAGSEIDTECMRKLFNQMHFKTSLWPNCTKAVRDEPGIKLWWCMGELSSNSHMPHFIYLIYVNILYTIS